MAFRTVCTIISDIFIEGLVFILSTIKHLIRLCFSKLCCICGLRHKSQDKLIHYHNKHTSSPASENTCCFYLTFVVLLLWIISLSIVLVNKEDNLYDESGCGERTLCVNPRHIKAERPLNKTKKYLTIGIPTVQRRNKDYYLIETLSALIENSTPQEREQFQIVIFFADLDPEYNHYIHTRLKVKFKEYIDSDFFHVMKADREYYPPLENLPKRFNDSSDRIKWRSKMVADFALLYSYAKNTSKYYLPLEDDVLCAPGYFTIIQETMTKVENSPNEQHWGVVSFSTFGSIGKLMRSEDLEQFSSFLLLFYSEMPVDWLINQYLQTKRQHFTSLKSHVFQHMGTKSSLGDEVQVMKDVQFEGKDVAQDYFLNDVHE